MKFVPSKTRLQSKNIDIVVIAYIYGIRMGWRADMIGINTGRSTSQEWITFDQRVYYAFRNGQPANIPQTNHPYFNPYHFKIPYKATLRNGNDALSGN